MSERKRYFIKQKIIGILLILLSIVTIFISNGDLTISILLIPLGLLLLISKKEIVTDNYFYKTKGRV